MAVPVQTQNAPYELTVVHVEEDPVDMRMLHEFRESDRAKKLSPGECIVGFNYNGSMARIVDYELGVHTYYADEGEKFSPELLRDRVRWGMATVMVFPEAKQRKGKLRVA